MGELEPITAAEFHFKRGRLHWNQSLGAHTRVVCSVLPAHAQHCCDSSTWERGRTGRRLQPHAVGVEKLEEHAAPPPPRPPQLLTVAPSKMALMILGSEVLTAAPFELGNLFRELCTCFQALPACYGSVSLPGISPLHPHP